VKLGIKRNARFLLTAVLLAGAAGYLSAYPQQPASQQQPAPDNTQMNQNPGATADTQKNTSSDMDTSRRIRKSIIEDKSLSTNAHNVKIITRNGMVTLKGPVDSDTEKAAIEGKAVEVAGKENVVNKLRVRATQSASQ
jgi:hyperosmotically inducible periplasmic protein